MSEKLYDTFKEFSRIEEDLELTDEGLYLAGEVPDDYGGMVLKVKVVHTIHLVNTAGNMLTFEFHNPIPKDKTKTDAGAITVDGTAPVDPANGYGVGGGGKARVWTTKASTQIQGKAKDAGAFTMNRRTTDA